METKINCSNCGEDYPTSELHRARSESMNETMSFCSDCWNANVGFNQ